MSSLLSLQWPLRPFRLRTSARTFAMNRFASDKLPKNVGPSAATIPEEGGSLDHVRLLPDFQRRV